MASVYTLNYSTAMYNATMTEIIFPSKRLRRAITQYVNLHYPDIKRGDIIQHIEYVNRDDTKCVWDGYRCLALKYDPDIDEYGYLPSNFAISQHAFSLTWWDAVLCSRVIWLHPDILIGVQFKLMLNPDEGIVKQLEMDTDNSDENVVVAVLDTFKCVIYSRSSLMNHEIKPVFFRYDTHLIMGESTDAGSIVTFECLETYDG